jgi:hypothetical protein
MVGPTPDCYHRVKKNARSTIFFCEFAASRDKTSMGNTPSVSRQNQHQSSSEALILGACIRDGVDFPTAVQRLIDAAPESFGDLRHGKTAAAIRAIQNAFSL